MTKREEVIALRVTETEKRIIENNAKKHNMKVATYIRMVAQNPTIIRNNYEAIQEHTRQIGKTNESINLLIYTIHLNNEYLPKEIDGIVAYIKEIWETENKLLAKVHKQWIKEYKQRRAAQKDN